MGHVGSLPDLRKDSGRKRCGTIPPEKKRIWCGWAPKTVEHKIQFIKKVMEKDGHGIDEHLTSIQKTIEFAAGSVAHCTEAERDKILQRTPDDVTTSKEAAARCTKVIKRRVLKKKSKESQNAALGEVLFGGKKKASRKLLTELHVDGHFTEKREEWQKKKLQRHCEEVIHRSGRDNRRTEKRIVF